MERNGVFDDAVRADLHTHAKLGVGADDGGGVNNGGAFGLVDRYGQFYSPTIMAPISASAMTTPSTMALASYRPTVRRRWILRIWYSMRSPGSAGLRNLALSMVSSRTMLFPPLPASC